MTPQKCPTVYATYGLLMVLVAVVSACARTGGPQTSLPRQASFVKSAAQPSTMNRMSSAAVAAMIDPSLPANERAFVAHAASVLRSMDKTATGLTPATAQIAVYDASSGTMYVNRRDLRGTMRALRSTHRFQPMPKSSGGRSAESSRRTLVYTGNPNPDAGTGPYRRMYTQPNWDPNASGVGAIRASVTVNCNAGNTYNATILPTLGSTPSNKNLLEDGNLLLGGWSQTGDAVDAGLMYNKNLTTASQDDYSPFFAIQNGYQPVAGQPLGFEYDHATGNKVNWHVPCNNANDLATITYFVDDPFNSFGAPNYPGNNVELVTQIQYYDPPSGSWRQIDLIYVSPQSGNWYGWSVACNQCVFKRETTIAQKSVGSGGPGDTFNNGDHFTATWYGTQLTCGFFLTVGCTGTNTMQLFDITDTNIKACEEYPTWTTPYNDGTRDCGNMPNPATDRVQVTNYSDAGELDSINLFPNAATPVPVATTAALPLSQTMSVDPVTSLDTDGVHLGVNVTNNLALKANQVTYRFSSPGAYEFQVYNAFTNALAFDSFAGRTFTQSVVWSTWAPDETKHIESVWAGYGVGVGYYMTINIFATPGGITTSPYYFVVDQLTPADTLQVPVTTPVYATPTPLPKPTLPACTPGCACNDAVQRSSPAGRPPIETSIVCPL